MATPSSILTWECYGQRSMVDYSLWGHKKSDMSEQLTHTNTHTHRGIPIHPTLTFSREISNSMVLNVVIFKLFVNNGFPIRNDT